MSVLIASVSFSLMKTSHGPYRYPMRVGGIDDSINLVLACQGHKEDAALHSIASTGAITNNRLHSLGVPVVDDGFYGSGICFTQWPRFVSVARPVR